MWVVEALDIGFWVPSVVYYQGRTCFTNSICGSVTRDEARVKLKEQKVNYPCSEFRIRKYRRNDSV